MSETNDYAVLAEGLVRNFGDVRAVDGIDLAVPKGEVYGFLGPNGAGKTTVVRILTTLLMPHGGRTMVAGKDVVREPKEVRLRVGAALQEAALDPKQTDRELLRLQGWLFGMSGREVDRRLAELESLMDIGDAINRFVDTSSGGMKRRLDLAAALIHDPAVLFLDEQTTGLDPISRNRVWEEVRRINKVLGVTIFLTTQYLEEADMLADRVAIGGVAAVSMTLAFLSLRGRVRRSQKPPLLHNAPYFLLSYLPKICHTLEKPYTHLTPNAGGLPWQLRQESARTAWSRWSPAQ